MNILVVDDNRTAADALSMVLRRRGHAAEAVYSGEAAIDRLNQGNFDTVITDLRMEPVDGLAVLAHSRALASPPEVLVVTGYGTVEAAVEAMRLGARDFLTKPVAPDLLLARLEELGSGGEELPFLAGESPAVQGLKARLEAAAASLAPVLLSGEPGTGRRTMAGWLHQRSGKKDRPFAVLAHPGRADLAQLGRAGALFLPGVDQLAAPEQAEMLRLLDALPDDGPRLLAAASPGWSGASNPELYYRLAVLPILAPPLRDRAQDIPALIGEMTARRARVLGRPPVLPAPQALATLLRRSWPGNLRELAAVVERALIFGPEAWALPPEVQRAASPVKLGEGFSLHQHLDEVERALLVQAMAQTGGDRTEMARILGVERNALRYKLNKYGLLD